MSDAISREVHRGSHGKARRAESAQHKVRVGITNNRGIRLRLRDDVGRLVARAADGDQRAWEALVDRFGRVVWATTNEYRLTPADAADVNQSTWMRLFENLDRIQNAASLAAWLRTTARRECLCVLRHASRVIACADDLPEAPCDVPHPVERLSRELDAVMVNAALERLNERDRTLLQMFCDEPTPSYHDVGAALDMPIGSIGPTRARALERLRRLVGNEEARPAAVIAVCH